MLNLRPKDKPFEFFAVFFFVVKSLYRKQIDELTKDSRIQKWVFATPEVEIDDPTGEIRRLKKQVHKTVLLIQLHSSRGRWKVKSYYPINARLNKN